MRILMFGRGVIATIYGEALRAAGHDVEFFVRPGRAAEYGSQVRMDLIDARRHPFGRRTPRTAALRLRESFDASDGFDLIVLSVGHHRLAEAAAFLAPRLGDATVLVFGNVWDEPLSAVSPIPAEQLVFGFPQAGGGFDDDDVLHGALLRGVILGTAAAAPDRRESAVRMAFQRAGLHVRWEPDMRGWLWLHFIADAGMFAQGLSHNGLAGLIGNRRGLEAALQTGRELLPILPARGVDLRRHRRALTPLRLPAPTAAVMAGATARLPIARMSLAAHTDPDAAEPRAVLADALREARRLDVPTPRLDAALNVKNP